MYVDLWGWFNEYKRKAAEEGNAVKQRLVNVAYEGWKYQRLADGENAIASFEEGLKLARLLHEPCWQLFYQHWIIVIRLYVQYDYQSTLDSTVRLVTEIRKEHYKDCVVRGQIVFLLARIYTSLDLNAYETEIVALLDYLEKELGVDEDTYLQMLVTRADIEIHHKRYDAAKDKLQNLINLSTGHDFRLYDAYQLLRRLAFIEGDIPGALNYNQVAQKYAQITMIQNCIAYEKLWEVVLLKYMGEDASAREKYYLSLAHFQQYKIPLDANYQSASVEYLELDGQLDVAVNMAESVLAIVKAKPSISQQIDAYCAYIALLGRNGRDFSLPLADVKAIAQASLKAEPYMQRIASLEAGNYFDYDWQKTSRKNNSGQG
jgi:hypothetical protein